MLEPVTTRFATEQDQAAIIELIDSVYREYGDQVCLTGADQDLLDIKTAYFDQGGAFWVMEDADRQIVGTHAAKPLTETDRKASLGQQVCTFRRLYLRPRLRGTQRGADLMELTFAWARQNHFQQVQFWSDSRFTRAHQFFSKLGFQQSDQIRQMDDGLTPYQEYFFSIELK